MKQIIILLVILVAGIIFAATKSGQDNIATIPTPQSLSVQQIEQQVISGDATLLDVRSQVEFDLEHAAPAQLFNVEWLKAGQRPDVSKDQPIYVYCRSGSRSAQAAEILRAEGYTVYDLGAFSNWKDAGGEAITSQLASYEKLLADLGADVIPILGDSDAPVTMIKYADFVCPFCAKYSQETEPKIFADYVDTGKVKYEFRNLAYLGDESAMAAAGGYCANEQNGFWKFHDAVIDDYVASGESAYSADAMADTAAAVGLERQPFLTCVESGRYDKVVSSETIQAQKDGFSSTPTFLINDKQINGALPLSVFTTTIKAEL